MKTIIIGGVAGGASAATRLRRLDESHEIVVLERSGYVSFANCGLPYYIGGTIADRRNLLLQTPKSLNARFGLDVRVHSEVIVDRPARAHGHGARPAPTGESYTEAYDHLILSPGASPIVPPIPGVERALTLRTIEDTDRIKEAVDTLRRRRATPPRTASRSTTTVGHRRRWLHRAGDGREPARARDGTSPSSSSRRR